MLAKLSSITGKGSASKSAVYTVTWALLDSMNHGVPLQRKLACIVGQQTQLIEPSIMFSMTASAVAKPPGIRGFLRIEQLAVNDSPDWQAAGYDVMRACDLLTAAGVQPNKADVVVDCPGVRTRAVRMMFTSVRPCSWSGLAGGVSSS